MREGYRSKATSGTLKQSPWTSTSSCPDMDLLSVLMSVLLLSSNPTPG